MSQKMSKSRDRSHKQDISNDGPTMAYSKYLYAGQKVVIKRVQHHGSDSKFDSISGTLAECHESLVEIKLHYGTEEEECYPFLQGMLFEVMADCFGLGLRFTCTFECLHDKARISLKPQGDLEFFFRRKHLRAPVTLWVSCERSTKSFRTLRRTWKKHTELLSGDNRIAELLQISKQDLSLGGGGFQINLKSPVIIQDLCLIYIALEDKGPLVCALCETVWVDPPNGTGHQNAGMEFRSILESDRQRITRMVKRLQQMK
jgi:c-di-GMP-binding flagellar brake protein YcgR